MEQFPAVDGSAVDGSAVIERIRWEKLVGNKDARIMSLKEELERSVARLSEDLYSSQTHFLMELIQNADDNEYAVSTMTPEVHFVLHQDYLLIFNNETGFSEENVRALCAVAKSTKSQRTGYIGEKGIGKRLTCHELHQLEANIKTTCIVVKGNSIIAPTPISHLDYRCVCRVAAVYRCVLSSS